MPRLNGTGPEGKGPMTGRKMGNCQFNNDDNNQNDFGRGQGCGRGRGRGCGRGQGLGKNQ